MKAEPWTVLSRDELCNLCWRASLLQNARVQMGIAPWGSTKFCSTCAKLDHVRRRETRTFSQAAVNWPELVAEAEQGSVRVPVKLLMPNGFVLEYEASMEMLPYGSKTGDMLQCSLGVKQLVFMATRQHPLQEFSDDVVREAQRT